MSMNAGLVVAGVMDTKLFLYKIWGDAINLVSKMEKTALPDRIQVTSDVVNLSVAARAPV